MLVGVELGEWVYGEGGGGVGGRDGLLHLVGAEVRFHQRDLNIEIDRLMFAWDFVFCSHFFLVDFIFTINNRDPSHSRDPIIARLTDGMKLRFRSLESLVTALTIILTFFIWSNRSFQMTCHIHSSIEQAVNGPLQISGTLGIQHHRCLVEFKVTSVCLQCFRNS